MLGPIFAREVYVAPRHPRHFFVRAAYVALLCVLMYTAAQTTFGWQEVRTIGDLARFGALCFQLFALLQLTLVMFFGLLLAASSIAQEKDRRTLILLLMTDLRNHELVLGKLFAALLVVFVLLGVSLPVFALLHLLGGVSLSQIVWSLLLSGAAAYATGSWGTLVAYWRDKTFQTLAVSVLGMVLFFGLTELLGATVPAVSTWLMALSPYRSLLLILDPFSDHVQTAGAAVLSLLALGCVLNAVTIARLRVWNPSQAVYAAPAEESDAATGAKRVRHRRIWSNPVLWREIRTRAYGRRVVVIKGVYGLIALAALAWVGDTGGELVLGMLHPAAFAFAGLTVLTLLMVNAQAVTSLTSERDAKTLELLLVTDITAREFIFGKMVGVLYNAKELILVPMLIAVFYWQLGRLTAENLTYLLLGYAVLVLFAAMLGLHAGLSFESSRSAIGNSLGTMFFLFVGIFVFMLLLLEARSSFFIQFQSFLLFIIVGSIGLYTSLTHKNPSSALTLAAGLLPFFTFYAITEYLLGGTLGVCLAIGVAYGFATLAMLIPAVSEFDVALGRTTMDKG
ncbi:MAG: ABC transporter permease [Planctomycetota bacterium]|nr:MAG: ABC transporter permease [Planctomycetota bacterium]